MTAEYLSLSEEVNDALADDRPVVALESTVISHGLPYPANIETATAMEHAVRAAGAVPATIGILDGRISVGLSAAQIERFATERGVIKVSRRDFGVVLAAREMGATTVAGTIIAAHLAGVRVFATGGIGGVHRGGADSLDISADLTELARSPVLVVCSGAKSILDLPRTLEVLETNGVPVLGFGTDTLPAFHARSSGLSLDRRVDSPATAAAIAQTHWRLGLGGLLLCNPVPEAAAIATDTMEGWIAQALADAARDGIGGKAVTPYLLARISGLSNGQTLTANRALLVDNARVAGLVAAAMAQQGGR